jgi:hypothetical protein
VKEASGIGYITSTIDANGASIMIHSPTETAAKVARMLVEINFKEQIKYQKEMQRLHVVMLMRPTCTTTPRSALPLDARKSL